jgi:DNA helicase HerA-like ATPase
VTAELIAVYGARGSGKSTLARQLVRDRHRVIVLDPSRDWQKRGVKAVRDLSELSALIARDWKRGFNVVYTAPPGKDALALHRLSDLICAYQEKFYRGRTSDEVTLVVDEMAEAYSNADAQSDHLSGFRRVILQGRHFGIGVVGISQRPADIAARFRDNCGRTFCFALHDHTSRDAIVKRIGRSHAGAVGSLAAFEYLAIVGSGVTRGKTRKS